MRLQKMSEWTCEGGSDDINNIDCVFKTKFDVFVVNIAILIAVKTRFALCLINKKLKTTRHK